MDARDSFVPGRQVDIANLKDVRELPEKRQQARAQEIRAGASFLHEMPRFPRTRKCRDLAFALLFLLTVLALVAFVVYAMMGINTEINDDSDFKRLKSYDKQNVKDIMQVALVVNFSIFIACIGGLITAFLWVMLARVCARPVVYASVYFIPFLWMVAGIGLVIFGLTQPHSTQAAVAGAFLLILGLLQATCFWCCYSRFIPFTIEVVEMVAEASNQNPGTIFIAAAGGLVSMLWWITALVAYAAFEMKHEKDYQDQNKNVMGPTDVAFFLVMVWGAGVISNVCHMTYCGIFSRWYFNEDGAWCCQSLKVALTTSFGSICFGTLIVAAIQAVQALLRSARTALQEDGNIVGCIVMLILECIVSVIGDLMEYFNEWVYVQCAIRGGNYCQSVRMTCAMVSCNGLQAIIAELLVNTVVTLGTVLSGVVGLLLACVFCFSQAKSNQDWVPVAGAIGGFLGGLFVGGTFMRIFSSGSKTILMCWAEEPRLLHQEHDFNDLHNEMNAKIRDYELS